MVLVIFPLAEAERSTSFKGEFPEEGSADIEVPRVQPLSSGAEAEQLPSQSYVPEFVWLQLLAADVQAVL